MWFIPFAFFFGLTFVLLGYLTNSKGGTLRHPLPPGPMPFPILGNLPQIFILNWKSVFEALHALSLQYGPVMTVWFGPRRVVVLSDPEIIREVMKRPEWNGRSCDVLAKMKGTSEKHSVLGIIQSEGKLWQTTRKFCFKWLHTLGLNTSKMEEEILKDVAQLLSCLQEKADKKKVIEANKYFGPSLISSLWAIVAGERDAIEIEQVQTIVSSLMKQRAIGQGIFWSFPLLGKIFPGISGFKGQMKSIDAIKKYIKGIIENHKATRVSGVTRDLVDAYLEELESEDEDEDGNETFFFQEQLEVTCVDLFVAASDTTSSTFRWALFFLAFYPEIQRNVYDELCRVSEDSTSYIFTTKDRPQLVQFEAFLMEVHRYASVAPIITPHRVLDDVECSGYRIPKNTLIFINSWGIHHNETFWKEPSVFNPNRFVEDGKLVVDAKCLIPFGSGQRRCPGETFAKTILYLMLSNLLYQFELKLNNNCHIEVSANIGLSLTPSDFTLSIRRRGETNEGHNA